MIRMSAIQTVPQRRKSFGPFTSLVSAVAMASLYVAIMSVLFGSY